MNDCIFCKVISGELPSWKVYETEMSYAFLDIAPANYGHTLVIPKKHYESYTELPDDVLKDMSVVVKEIAPAVQSAASADGISISMNNGKAAGQEIFHAHFHVIPRYFDDGLKHWPHKEYAEGEMDKMLEKITDEFK